MAGHVEFQTLTLKGGKTTTKEKNSYPVKSKWTLLECAHENMICYVNKINLKNRVYLVLTAKFLKKEDIQFFHTQKFKISLPIGGSEKCM